LQLGSSPISGSNGSGSAMSRPQTRRARVTVIGMTHEHLVVVDSM
jgi:hypothetical protein